MKLNDGLDVGTSHQILMIQLVKIGLVSWEKKESKYSQAGP
jgi:hypothetical protein